jgi:hypothetical protein
LRIRFTLESVLGASVGAETSVSKKQNKKTVCPRFAWAIFLQTRKPTESIGVNFGPTRAVVV